MSQYKAISDEMEAEAECGRTGQQHLERQLSWFGKTYCEDDDITFADKDKAKKTFIAFLNSYAESGTQIDKEQQKNEFRPKFTALYDAAFGRIEPNKKRVYDIARMNTYLEDKNVGYVVTTHQKYWTVDPKNWEQDLEE